MSLFAAFYYYCRNISFSTILLLSFTGFAQNDTLKGLVKAEGTEKLAKLEIWSSQKLFFSKPARKIELLNALQRIAHEENDMVTIAWVVFHRGQYVMAMDGSNHKEGIAMMQQAIALAEKNKQELQVGYFKHSLGYFYFTREKNSVKALQNMLQAHYIFERIGYENTHDPSGMLDRLSYVYYHLNNYNKSIKYLKLALKNPVEHPRRHISMLNTIGQSYRELAEPDSARKYFHRSRREAILAKDTAWIGITAGNIGQFYLDNKSYTLAKPFLEEYYRCGLAAGENALVAEALTGLADISLNAGKAGQALQQLKEAESLLQREFGHDDTPFENYIRRQNLFNVFAHAWDMQGNTANALYYLKKAGKMKDTIDHIAKQSKINALQQMLEAEQAGARLQLAEEEKEAAELKLKFYIAIGIALLIIIILLYSRQVRERKMRDQKETLLSLEKEKAENELESSKSQLEEYLSNLQQKAQLIDNIQSEMDLLRKQHPIPHEDENTVLQKLNLATILTEDDWAKFRVLFEKVHAGFFLRLKAAYPGLTPAETRLSSLIRLGLSSHQMAAMMGISAESVKKSRQRLRKKVNLSQEQKLEDLFSVL